MRITTESKAQNWRVVVVFDDRPDAPIFAGRSSAQVRRGCLESYLELPDDEERGHASTIQMRQRPGSPGAGRWRFKSDLKLPAPARVRPAA